MSISSIQFNDKKQEFIEQLIKAGAEPNNFEITQRLTEYFDNHIMGMPYYTPIKQIPYEASSKENYNHNFSTLNDDMKIIYKANIEANNQAVAVQQYYESECIKTFNEINKLKKRIDNLYESINFNVKCKQFVEVFDDLYNVEYCGNTKRNIPYTTAFADLLQNRIYTEKLNVKTNKISLSNATISINNLYYCSQQEKQGDKANILNDTISSVYIINNITTNNKDGIEIIVDLNRSILFNTVSISYSSAINTTCQLSLSEDGNNYINVYDLNNPNYVEWNFHEIKAQYIKIIILKSNPDSIVDSGYNEFHYYIKNISIAHDAFEHKSVFVSKPIEFDDLTSTIKLDATEMIHNNTKIDYFIGFDDGESKVGWNTINNHKDFKLYMFEKRHRICNYHINNSSYHEFGKQDASTELYKICELPKNINRNSIKVTPAYNMWSVNRYVPKDSNELFFQNFSLSDGDYTEFVSKSNEKRLFLDCENYDKFTILNKSLYIFTQYIDLEAAGSLTDTFIRVEDSNNVKVSDIEIRMFINGCEILALDTNRYSFALRKGVNKVQIAIYCFNNLNTNFHLHHNINFKALTTNVFGFTPMKYTTNIVLSKTFDDTYKYYTIQNDGIYVKCNPDDMIKSQTNDMGYLVTYYQVKNAFDNLFKNGHVKFRIMAILTSDDKYVSPALIDYRVTGR